MTGREVTIAAVDLGASSGRVVLARTGDSGLTLREVHRFANRPVRVGGRLHWDVLSLFAGIVDGLRVIEREVGRLDSVGVDSWGVDYGLLDADGQLLGNPLHYRDARTTAAIEAVRAQIGADELYAATGIQMQPFNTLYQLLSRRGDAQQQQAAQALLIPDLMSYWLSGERSTEVTNASTTQLLDARTSQWATPLLDRLQVPYQLFPPLRQPGTVLGHLRDEVADDTGLPSAVEVVTVPSHDTAAAVAGIPAAVEDFAFVCTGTWALVGLELPAPVLTAQSRTANFTNETGVDGTIRFLRNVTGFWLLQECVREWRTTGAEIDLVALTDAAADVPALRALIDVQDPAFSAPGAMPTRIASASGRCGAAPQNRAEFVRCILDSMALAVRAAIRDAVTLADRTVSVVHVVGGGVSNPLFCQLVADACQLPVIAGPTEAASWGNAMFQARALGAGSADLADARAIIAASEHPAHYHPQATERVWQQAEDRLASSGPRRA
jgi:rhamnulokinase